MRLLINDLHALNGGAYEQNLAEGPRESALVSTYEKPLKIPSLHHSFSRPSACFFFFSYPNYPHSFMDCSHFIRKQG